MEVAKMRWMSVNARNDKLQNDYIRKKIGVTLIKKMTKTRLQ